MASVLWWISKHVFSTLDKYFILISKLDKQIMCLSDIAGMDSHSFSSEMGTMRIDLTLRFYSPMLQPLFDLVGNFSVLSLA